MGRKTFTETLTAVHFDSHTPNFALFREIKNFTGKIFILQ